MEEGGRRRRVDDRSTVRLSSVGRTADVVERGDSGRKRGSRWKGQQRAREELKYIKRSHK